MVPGWIAGQYSRDEGTVDVAALAERAGAQFVLGNCTAIEPEARRVRMAGGQAIEFDLASIDTGGVGRARDVLGDDPRLLDIRPIDRFVERLENSPPAQRIAVIGGGAGGVELAFALRNRSATQPEVTLVTGASGLLPDMSRRVRNLTTKRLKEQGIELLKQGACFDAGDLKAGNRTLHAELVVAALGSGAPDWPRAGGLAVNEVGFIAVDRYQRSTSHPHIFAVGDVAHRTDREVPHSGVHAVFAGPKLAANLRSALAGDEPEAVYRPRWNNLYLMSTGDGGAIASYGPFAAQGRWIARLKHWIDKRWIDKYAALAHSV